MSAMLQYVLVALIVTAALAFCAWKLMPARWRLRSLLAVDAWAARHPALGSWRARLLKPRITRAAGPGCGGCASHDSPVHRSPR